MWTSQPRRSITPRAADVIDRDVGAILGDRRFEVDAAAASATTRVSRVAGLGAMVLLIGVGAGLMLSQQQPQPSPDRALTAGRMRGLIVRSSATGAPDPAPTPPSADKRRMRLHLSSKAGASDAGSEHSPSRRVANPITFASSGSGGQAGSSLSQASTDLQALNLLSRPQVRWLAMPTQATAVESLAPSMRKPGFRGRAIMRCRELDDGSVDRCAVVGETPARSGVGRAALWLSPQFRFQPPMGTHQGRSTEIEFPYAITIKTAPSAK